MPLNLQGYYDAASATADTLRDTGHDLGTALAHGGHKLKAYKAEQRAHGKKLGLLGFGVLPKKFGHKAYTAESPISFEDYKMKHGTLTSGTEDYTGFLSKKYGGTWEANAAGDSATREVRADEGTIAANRRQRKQARVDRRSQRRVDRDQVLADKKQAGLDYWSEKRSQRDDRREAFRTGVVDPLKENIKGQIHGRFEEVRDADGNVVLNAQGEPEKVWRKGLLDLTAKDPSVALKHKVGSQFDPTKKGIDDLIKGIPGAVSGIPKAIKKGLINFADKRELKRDDKSYAAYGTAVQQSIAALPDDPIYKASPGTGWKQLSEKSAYTNMQDRLQGTGAKSQVQNIMTATERKANTGSLNTAHGRMYLKNLMHETFGAQGDKNQQENIKLLIGKYSHLMTDDYRKELDEIINRYND